MKSTKGAGPLAELRENVADQVTRWGIAATQHGGGPVRAEAVAALSRLRQASLADLGRSPQMWAAVVDCVPDSLRGHTDAPSRAEVATFAALAMFSVHQQGQEVLVHRSGHSLGAALGRLARASTHGEAAMTRRFGALLTSESPEELLQHLRSLISLLRTARSSDDHERLAVQVDYGELARDLWLLMDPDTAPGLRLKWGREFAQFRPDTIATESNETKESVL